MPKLYKSDASYNFSTKFRKEGDHEQPAQNGVNRGSEFESFLSEQNNDKPDAKEDLLSPTKWLSKQILETSPIEADSSTKKSVHQLLNPSTGSPEKSSPHKSIRNEQKNISDVPVTPENNQGIPSTETLSKEILKKCFSSKYKNYHNQALNSKKFKTGKRNKSRYKYELFLIYLDAIVNTYEKSLTNQRGKNSVSYAMLEDATDKRKSLDKRSSVKPSRLIKHSASRGDLSTEYSRKMVNTSRALNKGNTTIEMSKSMARESIHHMNSPNKSAISFSKLGRESIDNEIEGMAINFNRGFMDQYYASNGYFAFSQTNKDMRAKDAIYDKLKTFVDERLLEVASQISVKHSAEEKKQKNIEKLTNLKENIELLIDENESILEIRQHEIDIHRKISQENASVQHQLDELRSRIRKYRKESQTDLNHLNSNMEMSKNSYRQSDQEFLENKQEIRCEMHDDKVCQFLKSLFEFNLFMVLNFIDTNQRS